jgi:alginate O-acetyltransferase complex protein AlgI
LFNSYLFLNLNHEFYGALVLGLLGMGPIQTFVQHRETTMTAAPWWHGRPYRVAGHCSLVFILVYSVASLMGGAHNPFLYFRF